MFIYSFIFSNPCPDLLSFFPNPSELEKKREAKQREREAREKEARKREKAEEKEKRRKEYNAQVAAAAAKEQQRKKNEEKKRKNGQAAAGGSKISCRLKHLQLNYSSVNSRGGRNIMVHSAFKEKCRYLSETGLIKVKVLILKLYSSKR